MALEYFPCYHSYRKKIAKLSDEEVGKLFRCLLAYSEYGEIDELDGLESIAFDFIADDIDRAKASYEEKCSKNRYYLKAEVFSEFTFHSSPCLSTDGTSSSRLSVFPESSEAFL